MAPEPDACLSGAGAAAQALARDTAREVRRVFLLLMEQSLPAAAPTWPASTPVFFGAVVDELLREAYDAGQREFGENYVQELVEKAPTLT